MRSFSDTELNDNKLGDFVDLPPPSRSIGKEYDDEVKRKKN